MTAFTRTYHPNGQRKVRAVLSSADTPAQRAEKIARLLDLNGDPEVVTQEIAVMADVLIVYADLDRAARGR